MNEEEGGIVKEGRKRRQVKGQTNEEGEGSLRGRNE